MRALPLLIALGLLPWTARADEVTRPNPFLAQAKVFFQGGEYEQCVRRLNQATSLKNPLSEVVEIELYAGLCKAYLGNEEGAAMHFEAALQLAPQTKLPPFTSPKVVARFEEIAKKVRPPAPPVQAAEASTESVTDAPKVTVLTPSAAPAYAPKAELAKGKNLTVPLVLGGVGVAAAGAFTYFGLSSRSLSDQARTATFESEARAHHQQAEQAALIANVGLGVAVAAVSGAVGTYLLQ